MRTKNQLCKWIASHRPRASFVVLAMALLSGLHVQGQAVTGALTAGATPATKPSGLGLVGYKIKAGYEKSISQIEAIPTTRPAQVGGTVFIGSSSFVKWKTLEKTMAAFNPTNCGFGGSNSDDVLYYAKRILKPLRPSQIVYYCGGNDVANKRTADIVFENFKSFVAIAREDFPDVPIYFIAQNIVPKRVQYAPQCKQLNQDVVDWAAKASQIYYIDAQPGLVNEGGGPIVELYQKDGVHLNPEGYKIWEANIFKGLSALSSRAKTKTAAAGTLPRR